MLSRIFLCKSVANRFFATSPVAFQQTQGKVNDPVQQLFLDKIREYATKQRTAKDTDALVDASPDQEKVYREELARIGRVYGVESEDALRQFPSLTFKDPACEAVEMPHISLDLPPEDSEDRKNWVPEKVKSLIE